MSMRAAPTRWKNAETGRIITSGPHTQLGYPWRKMRGPAPESKPKRAAKATRKPRKQAVEESVEAPVEGDGNE